MDFKIKYLKYKKKYLDLKKTMNQYGGGNNILISSEKGLNGTIDWINSQSEKYHDPKIEQDWKLLKNVSEMNFELKDFTAKIDFNLFHLRNNNLEENLKPLIILPGFSSDSLGMTLTRISKFTNTIFEKGFSDIYIFDFTGIGGRKKDKPEEPGIEIQKQVSDIPIMYQLISEHLSKYITNNYTNFSILGRSAGGGLSLQMIFIHKLKPNSLNVATPGYSFNNISEHVINYNNKSLPIRICWAKEDKKNPEIQEDKGNDGKNLKKLLKNNDYTNYEYYSISVGSDDDKLTHRILPKLINKLI